MDLEEYQEFLKNSVPHENHYAEIDGVRYVTVNYANEQIKQLQDEIAELKNNPDDPWQGVLNEEGEL